jgi:ABC-2 type transport system permease protein
MIDAMAVLRKELIETFGDRHSMRGALLQALITVSITGVLVPGLQPALFARPETVMMLYVIFPSTLAATMSADAFAGERERRTLETLLATPLAERSIFIGKSAAAIMFVMAVSITSLAAGFITSSARGFVDGRPSIDLILGVAGGALAGSLLISAATIAVSMRVAVARSAQQLGSILTFVLAGVGSAALQRWGKDLEWSVVLAIDVLLFVVGWVCLAAALRLFRRDAFFESR